MLISKKRSIWAFGMLLFLSPLTGCGGDPPVTEERTNMPSEVKAEEEKFEREAKARAETAEKRRGR